MTIKTTTHLNFNGEARAALEFYQSVFGGHQVIVTYKDAHAAQNPTDADHVLWGEVASEEGFRIMAYDVRADQNWNAGEMPFFVSVRGQTIEEVTTYWNKLVDGGTVLQPLGPSDWAPIYGMIKDRFGVTWVLDIEVAYGG